jgi:asparagine synthase (glutamine-hydrolysing)
MCGINGFALAHGLRVQAGIADAMNHTLVHRGPDEGGLADLGFAALAMRRLAIVDVRDGRQPMVSDDGRYVLVYNGELYDFARLRNSLAMRGRVFRTRADTEVLLQAWIADGLDALPSLNGMFAFAVADTRDKSIVLVRDPIGIKPLYYFLGDDGSLVFSSEIASLLAHPRVPRRLDRQSLELLFVDRYIADPWTLLEGVFQLPPGHFLRWQDGRIAVRRYADLRFEPQACDESAALEELRATLDETVRSQLEADVPVGVFLSGGIDSSTVAAFASRLVHRTGHRIASFSVGFARADHDESALAREVAAYIDTEHHEVRIDDAQFDLATLDHILDHVGQPLGDTSCIPTYILSKLAAEHVKVALSGDGGDEFFGGYDHMFWAARVRRISASAPAVVRRIGQAVLAGVSPVAPASLSTGVRRARKGLELSFLAPVEQFRLLRSLWRPDELGALLAHGDAGSNMRGEFFDESALLDAEPEEFAMAVLAQTYMPGAILTKVDRMSMAASLEVRVPLLDQRVVDFARRLPLELKIRGKTGKYLLRQAGRPLLPDSVYDHAKQGFSIPLHGWFNASFWRLLDDLYAPGSEAARLFRPAALERTILDGRAAEQRTGVLSSTTASTRVWLLASLARWMQRFGVAA